MRQSCALQSPNNCDNDNNYGFNVHFGVERRHRGPLSVMALSLLGQVLRGHMASVTQVCFLKSRAQLASFCKDKVLRVWDIQLQVCVQRLAGVFSKVPDGECA